MRRPSGEKAGEPLKPGAVVSCRWSVPSGFIVQIDVLLNVASARANAIRPFWPGKAADAAAVGRASSAAATSAAVTQERGEESTSAIRPHRERGAQGDERPAQAPRVAVELERREQREELRDHRRALEPRGRDEADRVLDRRVGERDAAQVRRQRIGVEPRLRGHAGQSRAGVCDERRDRVGLDRRHRRDARAGERVVDDPPVLHVGREQAERERGGVGPGHALRAAVLILGGGDEEVLLAPQRQRVDVRQRLVVEVGEPGVDLAVGQAVRDLTRGHRQPADAHAGVALAEAGGDAR